REALGLDFFDLLQWADGARLIGGNTITGHLQHGQGVQRDVRARPGVRGRGQVVGVGFARDLEHGRLYFSAMAGLLVNHSPSAQDCSTALALALPALAFSATSWKASNISRVCLSCSAATAPRAASSSSSTRVAML